MASGKYGDKSYAAKAAAIEKNDDLYLTDLLYN
jgi:hypothetical protein